MHRLQFRFQQYGSEELKDIDLHENYIVTCSDRPAAGRVLVGAISYDGSVLPPFQIQKPSPYVTGVETWQNFVFVTGRQFNGANGRDIFFMKMNLDSMFFLVSGQKAILVEQTVKVYPNPAGERLYVEAAGAAGESGRLMLYNMTGRLEKDRILEPGSTHQLAVGDLPSGLYVLVIQYPNQDAVTRKVLVVH